MNATTNFTVKSLRANKVRTLVTIAGVALAAALLTAVLTTYVSLNDYLYRSEAHLAGTWMACVEADGSSALDEKIVDAQADPQVAGAAILRDVGFAALTADQQNTQGTYLAIRSIEGDVGDICGITPSEGRLPENDHEIMLFSTWKDYGGVNLGDTVTFDVGQRVARLAPGEEGSMSAGTMTASWGVQGEAHESEITDGTPLNSSMGVLEAHIDGGIFNEEIANTEERTYTVVGFYDRPGYALSTAAGMVGVTAGGAAPDAFTDVFFTLNDVANTQQVEEAAEALSPTSMWCCTRPCCAIRAFPATPPFGRRSTAWSWCWRRSSWWRACCSSSTPSTFRWPSASSSSDFCPRWARRVGSCAGPWCWKGPSWPSSASPVGFSSVLPGALPLSRRLGRPSPSWPARGKWLSAWP